jgi:glycosyltransferase involved in cell wall biosynthesis
MKNVLFILPYKNIYPPINGGMQRYFNIINQLSFFTKLTVICFAENIEITNAKFDFPNLEKVKFICIESKFEPPKWLFFLSKKIIAAIYSRILTKNIFKSANSILLCLKSNTINVIKDNVFDYIIYDNILTLDLAKIIKRKFNNIIQIYDAHNFDTEIVEELFAKNLISKSHFKSIQKTESKIHSYIDILWTCSQRELVLFQTANNNAIKKINVIPNGTTIKVIDINKTIKPIHKILFVGSLDYQPNQEGLIWFINNIIPKINSNFIFQIVGSGNCPINLQKLIDRNINIKLIGFVENLTTTYLDSDIVVIPILSGSGTRLKVLEAMSFYKPIISTTKGVEGIDIFDNHLIIRDNPEEMAECIKELLLNTDLRYDLGDKNGKFAKKYFDWNVIGNKIKLSLH